VGALLVRGFYVDHERVARAIELQARSASNWPVSSLTGELVESDVDTLGTPLNVAQARRQVDVYMADALRSTRRFRESPRMSPLDKLRLELDEAHTGGCVVARDPQSRQLRAAGLVRIMRRGAKPGMVHVDDVGAMTAARGVFSANVYMQAALAGGEVEVWPVTFASDDELRSHVDAIALLTSADAAAQAALRRDVLPEGPTLVVRPQAGDLLMLCVQRPHFVRGPVHGPKLRLSVQTFVSHDGPDAPLKLEA